MKNKGIAVIISVAVLLVLAVYLFNRPPDSATIGAAAPKAAVNHQEDPAHASAPLPPEQAAAAKKSLREMTQVLFSYTTQEKKLNDLMEDLKNSQQEPYQVHDKNPYTGDMIIVRTKSPPPGTRYFHAQYFVEENGEAFAQHMSFEFRQSPEAMDQAIQMVKDTFAGLGQPEEETRDFVQWDLADGYVVWIKRLDKEDISQNPFNSYTDADIGSIRVAVEMNPEAEGHDQENDHDHDNEQER